jgi:hypothetical protein
MALKAELHDFPVLNKSNKKQKSKCPSVKIRNIPCKSVAKKFKIRIVGY